MSQLTPAWAIPYPDLTDPPNGAAQMKAMADQLDILFTGADGRLTNLENGAGRLGTLGTSVPGSNGSCTSAETIQAEVVTANVVSGYRYKITHTTQYTIASGAPTAQTFRFRVGTGGSVSTGSTLIRELVGPPPSGAWQSESRVVTWKATFSGQATFGVGWFFNAGATGTSAGPGRELLVECIGTV